MIDENICSSGDGSKVKYAWILVLDELIADFLSCLCVIFTNHSVDFALLPVLNLEKPCFPRKN